MRQQLLRRVGRMLAGDGNPLRRPVDKMECALLTGLIIGFLIAAPLLAVVAAGVAHAAASREQRAESGWTQVSAVLTESGVAGAIGLDGEWDTSWVTAHWTMPGGTERSGLVAVELNARAGQHVRVWVTPAGQLTHARLTSADVVERTAMAGAGAAAGLAVLLTIAAAVVRVVAYRRRMADWARAWEATGPRWSSLR